MNRVLALSMALASTTALAEDWTLSGEIGAEGRWFLQSPRQVNQQQNLGLSLMVQPEFRYQSDDRKTQISVAPFYRYDAEQGERSHFDLREAYWRHIGDKWQVIAGVDKVFWGVAESRHLVDVINQTDLVEDVDQEDKLGQPMVAVSTQREWGEVSLYWLPYFRERNFPGVEGRLRAPWPVAHQRAGYQSGAAQWHQDFALRYAHYFGDWDLGLHYFRGTGREAALLPDADGEALRPYYSLINQLGVDLQYTYEAWLWKFEGILRSGHGRDFAALVAGLEYSFYQVAESDTDLGLLVEYQYDGRDHSAPVTAADDDVFAGVRWALNDIQDTAVLAGVSVDRHTGEQFYNIEAERRIGEQLTAELRARWLTGSGPDDPAWFIERDDYIQLSLSYHL